MEPCLLCLEVNKGIIDCIKLDSPQWNELDIVKTIERHFWSLNTIQSTSWICSSCWKEVKHFHNFYLRIEEAHMNFGKIKVEDVKSDKDNMAFCFLEPEIQISQEQQWNFTESEEHPPPHDLAVDKSSSLTEPLDEIDLDDVPLTKICERMRLQNVPVSKDPLEKSTRSKRKRKNSKVKVSGDEKLSKKNDVENTKVKQEPSDLNDNDSEIISDNNNDGSDLTYQQDKESSDNSEGEEDRALSKQSLIRKENDKFIVEHFKLLGFKFICELCQAPSDDFTAMQKHFTKVHEQRGFVVCCTRKFFDRTRLVDHLHCHVNPDHFKCKDCGKVLSDRLTFDNHQLRVHRADEVVRKHSCDECGKSFKKACVLKIHKLTHLPEEEKKFPCSDCGKNYGSTYQLNLHKQAVHLRRFVKICNICGKAINSTAEFKVHMNKHEGIPLPVFNCDICGLRLTSERGLKLHKASQHPVGGKQEHHCPICPKISPTLTALRKHINTMHIKGYDHKCALCEKAFRKAETLKEHMASHTGTSLYTCPWCPKTFNSNGNMHAHRKNKHPKEYLELKLQRYN